MGTMESIIGPPGTGKTYALEQLIRKNGSTFIYLTYNRSMAELARKRIGEDDHVVGTFHSILSKHMHLVPSDFLQDTQLREWCGKMGISYDAEKDEEGSTEELSDFQRFSNWYSFFRNKMIEPFQPEGERLAIPTLYDKYEAMKEETGKLDYTDILTKASEADLPVVGYLYVDEAQDCSPLMWNIIDRWPAANKVIALDDEQTLYDYTGVDIRETLNHVNSPKILKECRRYGMPVHDVAERIIKPVRKIKREYSAIGDSEIGRYNLRMFLALPGTKAILCRTNYLARSIARILDIPAQPINSEHSLGNGWSPVTFRLHSISLHYPHLTKDEWEEVIKRTPAGIWQRGTKSRAIKGEFSLEYFQHAEMKAWKSLVPLLDVSEKKKDVLMRFSGKEIDPIYIDTIHAAKGLEFDHVLIASDKPLTLQMHEMEYRVMYVGATRARKSLDFHNFNVYADSYEMWRWFN